jgi:hypothetical protein
MGGIFFDFERFDREIMEISEIRKGGMAAEVVGGQRVTRAEGSHSKNRAKIPPLWRHYVVNYVAIADCSVQRFGSASKFHANKQQLHDKLNHYIVHI